MHRTDEFPDWILSGSEAGDNLGNAVADDPGGGLDVGAVVVAEEVTVEDQSPETNDGVEEAASVWGIDEGGGLGRRLSNQAITFHHGIGHSQMCKTSSCNLSLSTLPRQRCGQSRSWLPSLRIEWPLPKHLVGTSRGEEGRTAIVGSSKACGEPVVGRAR